MASKSRKRKSPKSTQIFEVSEKDLSPDCSEDEAPEPDAKVQKTRNSDVSEARTSSGPNLKIQEKLASIKKTFQNTEEKKKEDKSDNTHVDDEKIVETPVKDTTKKLKPKKVGKNTKKKQKKTSPTKKEKIDNQEKEKEVDKSTPPDAAPSTTEVSLVSGNTLEDGEVSDSTLDKVDFFKTEQPADSINVPIQPDISISFKSKLISDTYKRKLLRYLERFVELNVDTPSETTMHISVDPSLNPAEWHVVDAESIVEIQDATSEVKKSNLNLDLALCEPHGIDATPKKKKKDRKKNKNKDPFIVDSTPTPEVQANHNPQYFTRFLINDTEGQEAEDTSKPAHASVCFNCDKNHALKDCPVPKNMGKINANRNKFMNNKNNKNMGRYHDEEDQKYGHLVPGKISAALRKALGLKKNQMPKIFYQMRLSGYPPGWLEQAKIEQSNLSMFDIDGNDVKNANSKTLRGLDPDKIIEYPGFNVPLEKGIKDEYKLYRVPPYSEDRSKKNMIEYFEREFSKELDDFKTQDMEIEEKCSGKTPSDEETTNVEQQEEIIALKALEKQKETLLKKLDNDDSNSNSRSSDEPKVDSDQDKDGKPVSSSENVVNLTEDSLTSDKIDLTNHDKEKQTNEICLAGNSGETVITESKPEAILDDVSKTVATEETTADTDLSKKAESRSSASTTSTPTTNKIRDSKAESSSNASTTSTPMTNKIKDSTFGTPILKSASPYHVLPNQDNFSRDISPVINFENLPNSTGKYEQMTGVLQKVRKTLKQLSQCKS